ncbi:phenylalanine--tRNA ligase subunit beta [Rhodohalobacter sp. SW132]|uniref:phenylalanine--tRNA ligase subunit beta n=1 Tax=Rhodohalobacter sp. SW132 TaxID=2293433 RepID=UPI000E23357E|nr:phenylalanine--tRNA ligase subunit beta [Rhodohalobacter sp. SW132]REL37972.1 phenylalanine--tRNA ligase subunit beta [Rhodohalobacter sp. SW132]
MKISVNWLRQYVETDLDPNEIADKLTLLGLEVEEIEQIGNSFDKMVVGEVQAVRSHPNADKLQLCDVNTGDEVSQIVCGAPNVAKGQKVAVAKVGATMPEPMPNGEYLTIKKMKLRGESSSGMICSEAELGLSEDHSGIMVLNDDLKIGTPLNEALNIEQDTVLEIGLTPNRPDAACHIGVARDLAAVLEAELSSPYTQVDKPANDLSDSIEISIKNSEKCHRYAAFMVEGVTVEESPNWLKQRLLSIGLRPINNVVDITNYVLHEIGQPLHAFDYDKIAGKKIIVQDFDEEKTFTTLDDVKRTVPAGTLFICDEKEPVAVAGVMGGEDSEVTDQTKTILIESAYFDPSSIRKASKALTLQSDSSYRFERGIDPTLQVRAAKRAADLIAEVTGGSVVNGYADIHPVKPEQKKVSVRISRINSLLGTDLSLEESEKILNLLEFETEQTDENTLNCTVPHFRPDVSREVDLIEEVGRVYDYNRIPRPDTAPFVTPEPLTDWENLVERIRGYAVSLAYKEITTNSLLSKKEATLLSHEGNHIDTLNPVSQENTTLRPHLSGGFLKAVKYNLHRNEEQLRFFEIGHVFNASDDGTWVDGVEEHTHLLLGLCGYKSHDSWTGDAKTFNIFDLKADVEALFELLGIAEMVEQEAVSNYRLNYTIGEAVVGSISVVDEKLRKGFDIDHAAYIAEINITELSAIDAIHRDIRFQKVSRFPAFDFDAAFIVDQDVRASELEQSIRKEAGSVLKSIEVFDVYEGENIGSNKKSIAFRLSFLDSNKTLSIKDVEPIVKKVVHQLERTYDAKLRS